MGMTIRIFPTYMFLLFLFREASSSLPRSVPLICRENRYDAVWVSRSCHPNPGHRAPVAGKQPREPSAPRLAEIPGQAGSVFLLCWGETEGQLPHFRHPG